jgi:hypothetical protein
MTHDELHLNPPKKHWALALKIALHTSVDEGLEGLADRQNKAAHDILDMIKDWRPPAKRRPRKTKSSEILRRIDTDLRWFAQERPNVKVLRVMVPEGIYRALRRGLKPRDRDKASTCYGIPVVPHRRKEQSPFYRTTTSEPEKRKAKGTDCRKCSLNAKCPGFDFCPKIKQHRAKGGFDGM